MMSRKALNIAVELDVHAVTCPGVWLCPNGKVSLRICSMRSVATTAKLAPVFPLLFHEKFIFKKTFSNVRYLVDLHRHLAQEYIYAELVQWPEAGIGIVLSTFEASLLDVLFPKSVSIAKIPGIDVDLLMDPTESFPGILSPKLEISTKTTINEVIKSPRTTYNEEYYTISPKTLISKQTDTSTVKHRSHVNRQRKVCHSRSYPRKCHKVCGRRPRKHHKQDAKAPFVVRHADKADHKASTPVAQIKSKSHNNSKCKNKSALVASPCQPLTWQSGSGRVYNPRTHCQLIESDDVIEKSSTDTTSEKEQKEKKCKCGNRSHVSGCCIVCNQYKSYFSKDCSKYGPKLPYDDKSMNCKKGVLECPGSAYITEPCHSKHCCDDPVSAAAKLAGDLKQRIDDVLDASRHYPFLEEKEVHSSSKHPYVQQIKFTSPENKFSQWSCNRKPNIVDTSFREEFYQNLEKFYHKLYRRAKDRSSMETQVY